MPRSGELWNLMWIEPSRFPMIVLQVVLVNLLAYVVLSAIRQRLYPDTRVNREAAEYDYRRYLARISEFRRLMSLELREDSTALFRRPGDLNKDLPARMRRLSSSFFSPAFFVGLIVCGATVGASANTSRIPLVAIGLAMIVAAPVFFTQGKSLGFERIRSTLPPFLRKRGAQPAREAYLTQASGCVSLELSQSLGPQVGCLRDLQQQGDSFERINKGFGKRLEAQEPGEATAQHSREGSYSNALGSLFLELTSLYDLEQRLRYSRNKLGCAGRFQAGYFLGLLVFTLGIICGFERESALEVLQLPSLWCVLILALVLGWLWLMRIPRFVRLQDLVS